MAQPREAALQRASEDPQLRRMLATHIHCGEAMQLVSAADETSPVELQDGKNDGGLLTYRCACGFVFDQRQD